MLKLADQPLIVEGGRAQIQYIFRNLIDNAIRAIDETGNPSGTIEVVEKLDYVHELPWVVVTVSDTGTGISPENLGRLFELILHHPAGGHHRRVRSLLGTPQRRAARRAHYGQQHSRQRGHF